METIHKELLRKSRMTLVDQLFISDTIVQFLYQETILTESHVEEIESQVTNKKKTLKLLDILPTRGPRAFGTLLRSLEDEFPWVKEQLLQELEFLGTQRNLTNDWKVPDEIVQKVPSDRQLSRLASRLGPEWDLVLLDLGLSTEMVYRCRIDHAQSVHGQVLAGLVQWRQSQGRSATVGRLFQSLQAAGIHPSTLEEVFH